MDTGAAARDLTSDLRMRSAVRTNDAGGGEMHELESQSTSAHKDATVPFFVGQR
jgi:hypothetical protein